MGTSDGPEDSLKVTLDEARTIGQAFTRNDFSGFQTSGIVVAGVRYAFLRADDKMVFGRMKGQGAITLGASNTAVVIAHTAEGKRQGNTNRGVGVVAEYLK